MEKKLEEAKVLETCAVLQCERLYHDVIKEARDELGPDHALTVKVTWQLPYPCFAVIENFKKYVVIVLETGVTTN